MPRPRSFDSEEVLEKVMVRFWEAGYSATTLDDLEKVTGLKRVSLYNAFGDKRELFLEALRCYRRVVVSGRTAPLRDSSRGLDAIRSFFQGLLAAQDSGWPAGCLMVNTSIDETHLDRQVLDLVRQHFQAMENFFAGALERSRLSGELRAEVPTQAAAAYLLTFVQGLAVLGRNPETSVRVRDAVDLLLEQLDSWRVVRD